jgi:hypothetical protein
MKNTSVAICSYHRTFEGDGNRNIINFKNQGFDNFFVLFDDHNGLTEREVSLKYDNSPISIYNNNDFINYGFNKPINRHHFWGSHQNPKYFYAHYRMLVHYINNPTFKNYWFFDDDVNFTGDLKSFISEYDELDNDFMAIQIFKKENYEEFPTISVINNRMGGSRGYWLGHCPGPGDNFKSTDKHMGSFFPIVKFSKEAMLHLLKLHQENYFGYSEGFVPTSLASDGFKVESMMNEFNEFLIKNNNCELTHKGQKFTWEWL